MRDLKVAQYNDPKVIAARIGQPPIPVLIFRLRLCLLVVPRPHCVESLRIFDPYFVHVLSLGAKESFLLGEVFLRVADVFVTNRGEDNVLVYGLNYNLPSKANKTSELPSEMNKLNFNLPNETNKTSECEQTEF